jgi:hypothetical protein
MIKITFFHILMHTESEKSGLFVAYIHFVGLGCFGLVKGDLPSKEDVYVYRINIIDNFGNSHLRKGRVSLIR